VDDSHQAERAVPGFHSLLEGVPFGERCRHETLPTPRDEFSFPAKDPKSLPLDELELLPSIGWDAGFYDAWKVGAPAAERRCSSSSPRRSAVITRIAIGPTSTVRRCLSPHLHFGELSPRQVWAAVEKSSRSRPRLKSKIGKGAEVFLKEVGWREFALSSAVSLSADADGAAARISSAAFPGGAARRICERGSVGKRAIRSSTPQCGSCGQPAIMPNRTRMVVASFLTKDLPHLRGSAARVVLGYAGRRRSRQQHARLAMDRRLRGRCGTLLSRLQSDDAGGEDGS
jgi:deoxyribodipyrimidine photo-lyase